MKSFIERMRAGDKYGIIDGAIKELKTKEKDLTKELKWLQIRIKEVKTQLAAVDDLIERLSGSKGKR